MLLVLEEPYKSKWRKGYLIINSEDRRNVVLYNSNTDRTTISYARYLMGIKLGYEVPDNFEVDHKDDNKENDNTNNLQLLSKIENLKKQGLIQRTNKHGTLAMYRYCKCSICKQGKRLWNRGMKIEYYAFTQNL